MTKQFTRDQRETINSDLEIDSERQLDQATRDPAQDGQERYVERETRDFNRTMHLPSHTAIGDTKQAIAIAAKTENPRISFGGRWLTSSFPQHSEVPYRCRPADLHGHDGLLPHDDPAPCTPSSQHDEVRPCR